MTQSAKIHLLHPKDLVKRYTYTNQTIMAIQNMAAEIWVTYMKKNVEACGRPCAKTDVIDFGLFNKTRLRFQNNNPDERVTTKNDSE